MCWRQQKRSNLQKRCTTPQEVYEEKQSMGEMQAAKEALEVEVWEEIDAIGQTTKEDKMKDGQKKNMGVRWKREICIKNYGSFIIKDVWEFEKKASMMVWVPI